MRVVVQNLYTDQHRNYDGDIASIEHQLLMQFPHLRDQEFAGDLNSLLEGINGIQAYSAWVVDSPLKKHERANLFDVDHDTVEAMHGYAPHHHPAFKAARFLAGTAELSPDVVRASTYHHDGDLDEAALHAYGLEVNEPNLKALRAIQTMQDLHKADEQHDAVVVDSIEALVPEGQDTQEALQRAFKDRFVMRVKLAGKHSAGSLLARDEHTQITYLLKPGS